MYKKVLRATGVFALIPATMTGKSKFSQQKTEDERRRIAAKLKERGDPSDLMVADEIMRTLGEGQT